MSSQAQVRESAHESRNATRIYVSALIIKDEV
jgi:hypothetical protein